MCSVTATLQQQRGEAGAIRTIRLFPNGVLLLPSHVIGLCLHGAVLALWPRASPVPFVATAFGGGLKQHITCRIAHVPLENTACLPVCTPALSVT